MRKTQKLYYSHQYASKIKAKIVKVNQESNSLELDRTIAFPEGGGQDSDKCLIKHNKTGHVFSIDHVKRLYGHDIKIGDSHYVNVDGIIQHRIGSENEVSLEKIDEGDEVNLEIDIDLREKLTTSHSASHLLYLAIQKVRNDTRTIGCHIKVGQARFDFVVENRFTEQDLQQIETISNEFIESDYEIKVYPSEEHPDARFWECQGIVIPCGGTHLKRTGTIGPLKVRRKNIGKGKERVICTIDKPTYDIEQYKEFP